ncbi:hypothetical protein N0V84_005900 [Fusarium piperis]|uniref:Uncharacterized protein n=1 Tax=Fusarium piperis TaxID=1435070 RepID=A0A9W9BNM8_9HYPO|nr:hypothetical protein N0V84_005900 [Fusarium piperis]
MKYTLLTAAALATVAIAAPAPEKALSLGDLGLGGGGVGNKATVDGELLNLKIDLRPILEIIFGNGKNFEVPTHSKTKAKRSHAQGAQLIKTVKDLLGKIQGHSTDVDNILLRIRSGGLSRSDGTRQCLDLIQVISSLLDGTLGSLTGFPSIGNNDYDQEELLGLLGGLTKTLSNTVSNVARTLGVGGGQVGSGSLTPVTTGLSKLLECVLGIDPSLGTGLQGILNSILGGVGTGTGTGNGVGLLGGVLGDVLSPVKGLLRSLNLNVGINVGGQGSVGGETDSDSDDSSDDEDGGEDGEGSGSSGSGNESPVYNVPT